ncbi:MAG: hypothetical protein OXU31_04670 [Gammaproteobacteria bacterium]|nr:hypothetical protein [Gammaproteobacteria bacterium]MDD9815258.1 hypothetical protein [Gammaproteobacteria bacterium]
MSIDIQTIKETDVETSPDIPREFFTHLMESTVNSPDCQMSGEGRMLATFYHPKLVKTMEEFCADENPSDGEREAIKEWIDSLPWEDRARFVPKEERSDNPNEYKMTELYLSW